MQGYSFSNRSVDRWKINTSKAPIKQTDQLCRGGEHRPGKQQYLQLLIGEVFPQLLGNSLQIFERDFPRAVVIKEPKSLQDFFFGVLFTLLAVNRDKHIKITASVLRQVTTSTSSALFVRNNGLFWCIPSGPF